MTHTANQNEMKERECMFDVWMGVELTTFVLIFSAAVLLPIQLLLCFKVKKKAIRLFPIVVLFILMFIFSVMAVAVDGWDSLGYLFLAIFTGLMLIACGMGWGIWMISRFLKKK